MQHRIDSPRNAFRAASAALPVRYRTGMDVKMISLDDQQTAGDGQDSTGTTQFGETQQMRFQIRYYRDARWAERYERAGVDKPEGYVTSTAMPLPEAHVREVAAHINSFKPTQPCLVARVR